MRGHAEAAAGDVGGEGGAGLAAPQPSTGGQPGLRRPDTLVFPAGMLGALRRGLLADAPLESAAFVLARAVPTPMGRWHLVAFDVLDVHLHEYVRRTPTALEVAPSCVGRVLQRARSAGACVVAVHTHPEAGEVRPSDADLAGEADLVPALRRRVPGVPHARLILGPAGANAVLFAPTADAENEETAGRALDVIEVGADVVNVMDAAADHDPAVTPTTDGAERAEGGTHEGTSVYDRQVRAFGAEGQARLARTAVAIVGLGGTGSVVAQQLAHLGVRTYLLVDPETLDVTNGNRVVGAAPGDVGRPKVEVAADMIRRILPRTDAQGHALPAASITPLGDVRDAAVVRRLLDADVIFCCTDSHGSRAVLTQFAYQYLVPAFDVGVAIHTEAGTVSHIAGRVQMLAPGLACLLCAGVLDPEQVRRDLLTDEARAADRYIVGATVSQPAVISVNSVASSLAVTMFLSAFTGIPVAARHQRLRLEAGVVARVETTPNPDCPWCGPQGGLGRADAWPHPGRGTHGAKAGRVEEAEVRSGEPTPALVAGSSDDRSDA